MKNYISILETILSPESKGQYLNEMRLDRINYEKDSNNLFPFHSFSYFTSILNKKTLEIKHSINEEVFSLVTLELKKNYLSDIYNLISPLMKKCLNGSENWKEFSEDEHNFNAALYYCLQTLKSDLEVEYAQYLIISDNGESNVAEKMEKIKFLLTVPQLAFLFKSFLNVEMIKGKDLEIKKFVGSHISSKEQETISQSSFNKKWSDKELINTSEKELEELSDIIKKIQTQLQFALSKKNATRSSRPRRVSSN